MRVRSLPPLGLLPVLLLAGCGMFAGHDPVTKKAADPPTAVGFYESGVGHMNAGNYKSAVGDFDKVEINFPYSSWATNAQLMHGYASYLNEDYTSAIGALDRFIELHPANRDIAYAYYLRALCYYEQISDVQRDQTATRQAIVALQEVANRFPGSAYANDARLKIDLCRDHLAGHEMAIGRFYEHHRYYIAAIGRYREVVQRYQTTTHVPEALERLVECYLDLGMRTEALHAAAVLGYNYPGSTWYRDAYARLHEAGVVAGNVPPPKTAEKGLVGDVWDAIF